MACGAFDDSFGTNIDRFCNTSPSVFSPDVLVTGSEVERWGLGVVQEIDSAAMHLFARWQHQKIDLDLTGITSNLDGSFNFQKVKQGFESYDLFQVGGVIFF